MGKLEINNKNIIINCDNCGKAIKGEKYQIVNECFVPQRGLYHCGCVFKPLRNKK